MKTREQFKIAEESENPIEAIKILKSKKYAKEVKQRRKNEYPSDHFNQDPVKA